MSRSLRLTLLGAATMALMTGHAVAQAGTAPSANGAPSKPAESQTESQAEPQKRPDQPRTPGCPYRDSKLELIV